MDDVIDALRDSADKCLHHFPASGIYIGVTDEREEGTFVADDGSVPYALWYKGEPNGNVIEQCVLLDEIVNSSGSFPYYYDVKCSRKNCFACNISANRVFTLRGLCLDTV